MPGSFTHSNHTCIVKAKLIVKSILILPTLKYFCINHGDQRIFSVWNHPKYFIYLLWILMLWVYGHQKWFNSFSAGIVFIHQNPHNSCEILNYKDCRHNLHFKPQNRAWRVYNNYSYIFTCWKIIVSVISHQKLFLWLNVGLMLL